MSVSHIEDSEIIFRNPKCCNLIFFVSLLLNMHYVMAMFLCRKNTLISLTSLLTMQKSWTICTSEGLPRLCNIPRDNIKGTNKKGDSTGYLLFQSKIKDLLAHLDILFYLHNIRRYCTYTENFLLKLWLAFKMVETQSELVRVRYQEDDIWFTYTKRTL